jgi:hypothetical protein
LSYLFFLMFERQITTLMIDRCRLMIVVTERFIYDNELLMQEGNGCDRMKERYDCGDEWPGVTA